MTTVNRGWLKRQIAKGGWKARCIFHYTDDYAWDNANNGGATGWLPCRVVPGNAQDFVEGVITFHDHDFTSKSGLAYYVNDASLSAEITLTVYSNLVYSLRKE